MRNAFSTFIFLHSIAIMDLDDLMNDVTCLICNEVFNSLNRKPKILPCGHTYCQLCLKQIENSGELKCPYCREVDNCSVVDDLPLNFIALNISERLQGQQEPEKCLAHNEEKRYWCTTCNVHLCGLCIFDSHARGEHRLEKFSDYLKRQHSHLDKAFEEIVMTTTALQHCIDSYEKENIVRLLLASKFTHDVSQFGLDITEFQKSIKTCKGVTLLESLEDTAKVSQEKITTLTSSFEKLKHGSCMKDPDSIQLEKNVEDFLQNKTGTLKETQIKSHSKYARIAASSDDGRYALLSWEENKLHVTSFGKEGADLDHVIKWSMLSQLMPKEKPEVFLELTTDDIFLGKINIVLWGHLRRAQQFMALCLGSLGPTYCGTSLRECSSCKNSKFLVGGSYVCLDGTTGKKGLMENLEWNGDYRGRDRKGLVVSYSGGHAQDDALFAIVIDTDGDRDSWCPFGEVISGIDVAVKASTYEQVNRVKISRCGVILSFFEK